MYPEPRETFENSLQPLEKVPALIFGDKTSENPKITDLLFSKVKNQNIEVFLQSSGERLDGLVML